VATLRIPIEVVNGSITCGRSGGNLRASRHTEVEWYSEKHFFSLEFFLVREEGTEEQRMPPSRWPFDYPKEVPEEGIVRRTQSFKARLARVDREPHGGVYKYHVTVFRREGDLRLDPIIIMD
jgi:hypothetical protein